MSSLVRKEIRLVLPAWIVAMVLAVVPVWLLWPGRQEYLFYLHSPGALIYAPFALGVLLLGLSTFGQELNYGTFSLLLAQPVSRRRIWRVKTGVLATALALAFVALFVSLHFRVDSVIDAMKATNWSSALHQPKAEAQLLEMIAQTQRDALHNSVVFGGLCALAALAGGLWTNLLFRNTSAAFWFALLIPLGLGLLTGQLFGAANQTVNDAALVVVLGGYSVAGFLWARKFFLRVQDVQWTGGTLALPSLLRAKAGSPARKRKPVRALVRKEFQTHQVNVLIAGIILLSHLANIAARRLAAHYFATHQMAAMIWGSWPLLWLAMPLLIGGVAVAEERKLGTLETFLCLPTTRRREFFVKFGVALLLGVVLGGLMPLLVERLGLLTGLPNKGSGLVFGNGPILSTAFVVIAGSAGLTALAFYASTLTRNLLQSLGLAVTLSVFTAFLFDLVALFGRSYVYGHFTLWSDRLAAWIGGPIMILTLLWLAYRNFTHSQVAAKLWWRNLVWLASSLAGAAIVTTFVYQRTWELWMPTEPPPRGVFFPSADFGKGAPAHPKVRASSSADAVLLPDGRLWLRQRALRIVTVRWNGRSMQIPRRVGWSRTGYVPGQDWHDVAISAQACYALRVDGSLWRIHWREKDRRFEASRFGVSNGWRKISGSGLASAGQIVGVIPSQFIAVRSDGTLWEWSDPSVSPPGNGSSGDSGTRVRVGTDHDWVDVLASGQTRVAVKTDGSFWRWGGFPTIDGNGRWTYKSAGSPEPWLTGPQQKAVSLSTFGQCLAAVYSDGSLWLGGYESYRLRHTHEEKASPEAAMLQFGSEAEWEQVQYAGGGSLMAIRRDGSLWSWNLMRILRAFGEKRQGVLPRRLSHYSDWIALGPSRLRGNPRFQGSQFLALARDGSLCLWNSAGDDYLNLEYYNGLLAPSRIKARRIASLYPNPR